MEFVDEDTLVWDKSNQTFSKPEDVDTPVKHIPIHSDSNQAAFLQHFDKAENQLLNISSPLLATVLKISTMPEPYDLTSLREEIIQEINNVKESANQLTYPVAVIDKLCFLYAVVIDELIIYTDWGEKKGWENKTLLSELFGMRNGGELFFNVTEKAIRQPHKMIDLIEIIYIFVSIGFKGQYREHGSDQLKASIHQLEQLISQYRQSSHIYCHTKVSLPKVRKPARKSRYVISTLFYLILIITSVGLTQYWYNETHPQRARDFAYLDDFSQRYILSSQASDIIYISTDDDLEQPTGGLIPAKVEQRPVNASTANLNNSSSTVLDQSTSSEIPWLVQLATFSSKENAAAFIKQLSPSSFEPLIDEYKSYFRVIVRTTSSTQAKSIKQWYQSNDSINAIIVKNEQ
ncbi:type IVB secretion system protein IcmH/DotU [Vibrio sp. ZSDE26]|uniref:Type IVB secretion system protein IcmH/DotU n=1 Tax=Vibrio amylolyticus TaxID=2847292 RepID=A0A9X1XQA0_9VIBR|nr:type IVB secretion system protein IcmH/DotU [Vibrio amylolyticus]MCK6265150.1 type IVB secretion system protein IcmH/DotU [Vibrio amylolyticus]